MDEIMEAENDKFEIAMKQLDNLTNQLQRGLINQTDFYGQRLLVLIDLSVASVEQFIKQVQKG
jgi:hypothetical protein